MTKIAINKSVGGFGLSLEQFKELVKIADTHLSNPFELMKNEDATLISMIREEKEYVDRQEKEGLGIEYIDIYPEEISDYYRFRTHPWIVEVCEKIPYRYNTVVQVDSRYFRIVEREDGTEYVLTPELDEFLEAFTQ